MVILPPFTNACIALAIYNDIVSVFVRARYRVVKITCSYSKIILQTMKNYKAHYSLSWFMPLL
jgi:hypothetical protein